MFKLVIQDDEGKTTVVPLIRDEITIGRKEGNTIRLTERNVSRRHARILRNNGEVSIEDLGSYNGIRVNNARIAERVALRVSDQVQIGDYKLYLKAEGVEQVDDARTMPIERVDNGAQAAMGAPTDIMPAVAAAPTAPVSVPVIPTPVPGAPPPNAKLVGSPAHTLVAVADTDPQGRPVASQAQVAALTSQPGYGRLVVLSSNFAGKEFELSRPQMIVGRTDENDLVVNHRSISRNHAKIVREPDTGRYTISDLQSSNGVRVNGQDYGKVELRRGDVIDLGHVRLRFVEPGEDFVFSRDAVITDVPETGSKKGVFVFIGLAVLVLAFAVVWMMRGGDDDKKIVDPGNGTGGAKNPPVDADRVAITDPPIEDAMPVDPPLDTGPGPAVNNTAERDLDVECKKAVDSKRWEELSDCAGRLKAINPTRGQFYSDMVKRESDNEVRLRDIEAAVKDNKDLPGARKTLAEIDDKSVYLAPAKKALKKAEDALLAQATGDLRRAKNEKDCKRYEEKVTYYERFGGGIAGQARTNAGRCNVDPPPDKKTCPGDFQCANDQDCRGGKCVAKRVEPPPCDFDKLKADGDALSAGGNPAGALSKYQQALGCRYDGNTAAKAFLAACISRNEGAARSLYPKLPANNKNLKQRCIGYGMDPAWFP